MHAAVKKLSTMFMLSRLADMLYYEWEQVSVSV